MPYRPTGRPPGRPRHPGLLTPAELRVLALLREGRSNAEIASSLGLSPETVHTHVNSMLAKLDLHDRRSLAAWQPVEAEPVGHRRWWGIAAFLRRATHPGVLGVMMLGSLALVMAGFLAWYVVRMGGEGEEVPATTSPVPTSVVVVPPTPVATTTRPSGSSTPTVTPTVTATATAPSGLPPIPEPIVGYPPGTRTGIEEVDRVLEAVEAGDVDALMGMVGFLRGPCVVTQETGHEGPVCREGEAAGTDVEYFFATSCAPFGYFRPDEEARIRKVLAGYAGDDRMPFAVFDQESPPAIELLFASALQQDGAFTVAGSALWVTEAGVGGAYTGCGEPPGERLARETAGVERIVMQPPAGGLVWQRTVGGGGRDAATGIVPSSGGGALIAGWTAGPLFDGHEVRGESDGFVAVVGGDGFLLGSILVDSQQDGGGAERLEAIARIPGGLVAVGSSTRPAGSVADDEQPAVWQFAGEGEPVDGDHALGVPGATERLSAVDGGESATFATGYAIEAGQERGDVVVYRLRPGSDEEWRRTYGGVGFDAGVDVAAAADGGAYVLGLYDSTDYSPGDVPFPEQDLWLLRLAGDGGVLWEQRLDLPDHQTAGSVVALADGGAVIAGITGEFSDDGNVPRKDALLLARFSADGDLMWQTEYNTVGDDQGVDVAVTASGDIVVAGVILETSDFDRLNQMPGFPPDRLLVARFSPDGELRWVQAWPVPEGPSWDPSLALANDRTVWVAVTVGPLPGGKGVTASDIGVYRFFVGE